MRLRRRLFRRRPPIGHRDDGQGFTMVEMLTVALIMGTLARISVPDFHNAVLKARAASVAGDFEVVRVAALNYHAKYLKWPANGYPGQVPQGLAEFLPEGFTFRRAGYQLGWENWTLPDGLPQDPQAQTIMGISIVTQDRELGAAVVHLLGAVRAHYTLGDTYTFVIRHL